MNKVILEGFLGSDPTIRYTKNDPPVCVANLSIATHERRGETDFTEWHRVFVLGKIAEAVEKYYTKGKQVLVEGSLQTRKWVDKSGVTRYTTEIKAGYVRLLGKNDQRADDTLPLEAYGAILEQAEEKTKPKEGPPPQSFIPPQLVDDTFDDSDIPF